VTSISLISQTPKEIKQMYRYRVQNLLMIQVTKVTKKEIMYGGSKWFHKEYNNNNSGWPKKGSRYQNKVPHVYDIITDSL